jgi:glycosyltransferase involved in cell wall biosynthesis
MNKPFVSVIVPMYNSQETIESCLDSLVNLDYPKDRYELIIVDDHSTDESVKIAREFANIYDNIRLLNQKIGKKGPAAARNFGIKQAKGEFIASTDSDETKFPNWLNECMPYFSNSKIAAVGSLVFEKHPLDSGISPKIQSIIINPAAIPGIVRAGSTVYRKKYLQEVGGFNEFCTFNDLDVELHNLLLRQGYELKAIKKYIGQHKQRHSLKAFYNRMKGFGAAGLIMSFFNFKEAFKTQFKNQKWILQYSVLFAALTVYLIFLAVSIFINIKLTFLGLIFLLASFIFISFIWAFVRIKRTNSSIFYFPLVSFYIFIKLIAIIQGAFYGFFYYLRGRR